MEIKQQTRSALWALLLGLALWLAGCAEAKLPPEQADPDAGAQAEDAGGADSQELDLNNQEADGGSPDLPDEDTGSPVKPCEVDGHCPQGQICVENACTEGQCRVDQECPSQGDTCQDLLCVPARLPEVEVFALDSAEAVQGRDLTLSWSVRWADAVTITAQPDNLSPGRVETQGSHTLTAIEDAVFTLEATNSAGVQQATVSLRVLAPLRVQIPAADARYVLEVEQSWRLPLEATGGAAPLVWSVEGQLPPGVSLDPEGGVLEGSPTAPGEFPVTVVVQDSFSQGAPQRQERPITLQVNTAPLQVASQALPEAIEGQPYQASVQAGGGQPPYRWSVLSGGLPAGVTLGSDGTLSGQARRLGTYQFEAQVRDSLEQTASAQLSLTVAPPPLSVVTQQLPVGRVGDLYEVELRAQGGAPPYQWILSGALPPGVSLNQGTLRGTPEAPLETTLTLQLRDSQGTEVVQTLALSILPAPLSVVTQALPPGALGQPYSASLEGAGGQPPYTWSAEGLPVGLALRPEGVITGTPEEAGDAQVRLILRDDVGSDAAEVVLPLQIAGPAPTVTTEALPEGRQANPYQLQLQAEGGLGQLQWRATGLPPGVTCSAQGQLSGSPAEPGTFAVVVTVSDELGREGQANLPLVVRASPPRVATEALPPGALGQPYSATLEGAGGTQPYTWELIGGSLPQGLTLSAQGDISGTPQEVVEAPLTVRLTDAGDQSAQAALSLVIAPAVLQVGPEALPQGRVGQYYAATLQVSGASGEVVWQVQGLPEGLQAGADGVIAGTPVVEGTFDLQIQATDAQQSSGEATLTLVIQEAVQGPPGFQMIAGGFVDISAVGQRLDISQEDDALSDPVQMGFDFGFYQQTYSALRVSSNGAVFFGAGTSSPSNRELPSAANLGAVVAPFWDDLDPGDAGDVYVHTLGAAPRRRAVVQWKDVDFFSGSGSRLNFEVIFYEGSDQVQFLYGPSFTGGTTAWKATGASATLGLGDDSLGLGLTLAHNEVNAAQPGQVTLLTPSVDGLSYTVEGWQEASGRAWLLDEGTVAQDINGDDTAQSIPIGFSFSYYGQSYTEVVVGSNGLLAFGAEVSAVARAYNNRDMGSDVAPNAVVAVCWDDLTAEELGGRAGQVSYQLQGQEPNRRLVIQWLGMHRLGQESSRLTFQAVLHEGTQGISVHYMDMDFGDLHQEGASATVGLEDADGANPVTASHNSPLLAPGSSLWFIPASASDTSAYLASQLGGGLSSVARAGTLSAAASHDDIAAVEEIGFAWDFYGQSVTSAVVSSNGWVSPGGEFGSSVWENTALPDVAAPHGVLAPFWDDLDPPLSGGQGQVWTAVRGQVPNRQFVIEWSRVPHNTDAAASLTFQVILREAGGAEFVYGPMLNGGGAMADGNSATIGVEAPSEQEGLTWSLNQAGLITSGSRVLLWPLP